MDGKKRKMAELLELCKNAVKMKLPKVDKETELQDDLIKSKITLPGVNTQVTSGRKVPTKPGGCNRSHIPKAPEHSTGLPNP